MLKLVLVALAAIFAFASADHSCDELTIIKLQGQWARAYSHGHSREHFAEAVWRTAFNLNPALKEFLHSAGSDDISTGKFRAFALRSLATIEMSVTFLSNKEALKAEFDVLHKLQEDKHIPDEFIDVFLKALQAVLPAQLGRCYDRTAWKDCMGLIAEGIKGH